MKYGFNFITQALSGHGDGGVILDIFFLKFRYVVSRKTAERLYLSGGLWTDSRINLLDGCVLGPS